MAKKYNEISILRDFHETILLDDINDLYDKPQLPQITKLINGVVRVINEPAHGIIIKGINGDTLTLGQPPYKLVYLFKGGIEQVWEPHIDLRRFKELLETTSIINRGKLTLIGNPIPLDTVIYHDDVLNNVDGMRLVQYSAKRIRVYIREFTSPSGVKLVVSDRVVKLHTGRDMQLQLKLFDEDLIREIYRDEHNRCIIMRGHNTLIVFDLVSGLILVKTDAQVCIDTGFVNALLRLLNPYYIHEDIVLFSECKVIHSGWVILQNMFTLSILNPLYNKIEFLNGSITLHRGVYGILVGNEIDPLKVHNYFIGLLVGLKHGECVKLSEASTVCEQVDILKFYPRIPIGDIVVGGDYIEYSVFNPYPMDRLIEVNSLIRIQEASIECSKGASDVMFIKPNIVRFPLKPYEIVRVKLRLEGIPPRLLRYRALMRRRLV